MYLLEWSPLITGEEMFSVHFEMYKDSLYS